MDQSCEIELIPALYTIIRVTHRVSKYDSLQVHGTCTHQQSLNVAHLGSKYDSHLVQGTHEQSLSLKRGGSKYDSLQVHGAHHQSLTL